MYPSLLTPVYASLLHPGYTNQATRHRTRHATRDPLWDDPTALTRSVTEVTNPINHLPSVTLTVSNTLSQ